MLSIALRSLWLVQPDDLKERELRVRRASLSYFEQMKKIAAEEMAAGVDVGEMTPERFENTASRLRQLGVRPVPSEYDLAVTLELLPFYTRVYRVGSGTSHYSIGAALDGFLTLTHDPGVGPVALQRPDPEHAIDTLARAAITYGAFLYRSDSVIKHGLGDKVFDLVAAMTA